MEMRLGKGQDVSMNQKIIPLIFFGLVAMFSATTPSAQAAEMPERIQEAYQILDKKQNSSSPISARVLSKAKGVAIFTVTKAGLLVGGQGGEGIVISRLGGMGSTAWSAPSAFNIGGASIGAQIGFTETRYIVILNTAEAIRYFTRAEKFTMNATATGTAGTANETERVSTSDLESGELVIYKDSGGVYGGATIGGTEIMRKDEINQKAYGSEVDIEKILDGSVKGTKAIERLYALLNGKS
jgi:SH3 domain-containing YSC84-like protein 1